MNKAFSNFTWENDPSVNTPLSAENLNRVNKAVNEIDNRVISHDTTKANQTDMLTALTGVSLDESTGIFTFTRHNGTKVTLDTRLEKVIMNWNFDSETQTLYLILQDGSEMPVDLSAFITNVEFTDSTTIRAVIGSDGKVSFEVIDGSITENKLEPNYLANVQLEATKASQSATNAQESAESAESSALRAEKAAEEASAAVGGDFAPNSRVDDIISGNTKVGNADKLDGHESDYFASKESVDKIVLKEIRNVYVSPDGSDETGDGTAENPWATIQKAVDECPVSNNSTGNKDLPYYINLADGTYTETTIRIAYKTNIYIRGVSDSPNITIQGVLRVGDSYVAIVSPITFDGTVHKDYCVRVSAKSYFVVTQPLTIVGANASNGRGIDASAGCMVNIQSSISCRNLHSALYANAGEIYLNGAVTIDNSTYGLRAFGGVIRHKNAVSYGSVNVQTETGAGGRIYTGEQNELTTANKPSGSYTGNGSATERTVATGGTGKVLYVYNSSGFAFVSAVGAMVFYRDGTTSRYFDSSAVYWTEGAGLHLITIDKVLNGNGVATVYQVL